MPVASGVIIRSRKVDVKSKQPPQGSGIGFWHHELYSGSDPQYIGKKECRTKELNAEVEGVGN